MTDEKAADKPKKAAAAKTPEELRADELAAKPDPDLGIDGVNPITPNNPPRNSQPDVSRPHD